MNIAGRGRMRELYLKRHGTVVAHTLEHGTRKQPFFIACNGGIQITIPARRWKLLVVPCLRFGDVSFRPAMKPGVWFATVQPVFSTLACWTNSSSLSLPSAASSWALRRRRFLLPSQVSGILVVHSALFMVVSPQWVSPKGCAPGPTAWRL